MRLKRKKDFWEYESFHTSVKIICFDFFPLLIVCSANVSLFDLC